MKNILVIEDEKEVRETIVEILEIAGYKASTAENGEQALNILENEIPDLIISDIMMPKMDGYQVLDYFYNSPLASKVPFIFLSGKSDSSEIRIGMNKGADDYITKPFRAKELLQSIDTQLKKRARIDKKIEEVCNNINVYISNELGSYTVSQKNKDK